LLGLRSPIIDLEHLQLFSSKALLELFKKAGFEHIELNPIRNAYPLRYWLRLIPLPTFLKSWILGLLERFHVADYSLAMNVGNVLAVGFKRR
jgi:hypothetical protein